MFLYKRNIYNISFDLLLIGKYFALLEIRKRDNIVQNTLTQAIIHYSVINKQQIFITVKVFIG